jgi:hypothetical protein
MAEEAVGAGVRRLFALLPRQSALRRPLTRVLLDGVSIEQVQALELPIKESTIKRYVTRSTTSHLCLPSAALWLALSMRRFWIVKRLQANGLRRSAA